MQEHKNREIEVSAVDPTASMGTFENENLESLASEVQQKLLEVIKSLN